MSTRYKSTPIKSSEITPEHIYKSRRQFLKSMGFLGAGALLAAACGPSASGESGESIGTSTESSGTPKGESSSNPTALADTPNTFEQITNYNNYYEFTTSKERVASLAEDFVSSPWQVQVYGLVNNPRTYGLEDLLQFTQEERVYRMRCVEGWSMVIPWLGFPLSAMLDKVEPTSSARFVRFETLADPDQMPGLQSRSYPWPYQEGLRLDEAMNDLTLMATGLYGKPMPNQNGAPIRLVVPWKYGFKSIKSIIKMELVDYQPDTFWETIAPNEYGFYSNVNPEVSHPRWSQAVERRIGEKKRRPTLMFNGYAEEVGYLYEGMDLKENY